MPMPREPKSSSISSILERLSGHRGYSPQPSPPKSGKAATRTIRACEAAPGKLPSKLALEDGDAGQHVKRDVPRRTFHVPTDLCHPGKMATAFAESPPRLIKRL
jgi:hypothetical protein